MDRSQTSIGFFEEHFDIHGEFCGKVYKSMRNGVVEKYDYQPVSHYRRTSLTIRNENIRKFAAIINNPRNRDYSSLIRKLNYYTPYILNTGSQKFLAETVFCIREKGDYEFIWRGNEMGNVRTVFKRTCISLSFHSVGEKFLELYKDGELYCQRYFLITSAEDLDAEYENWIGEHFEEIIQLPEPKFERLKTYRRGMRSKRGWISRADGKFEKEVCFARSDLAYKDIHHNNPWIYHRKIFDHSTNPQTIGFCEAMDEVGQDWQALSGKEKNFWNIKANKLAGRRITGFNLFTSYKLSERWRE